MTTAHRPTFDPARGKDAQRGPAYHQRLLPAHTQLKVRQPGQGGDADDQVRDLRSELLKAEAAHFKKSGGASNGTDDGEDEETDAATVPAKRRIEGDAGKEDGDGEDPEAKRRRVLEETREIDADSDGQGDGSSSDESDDEEEDEEAELLRELEKIKKERAEQREKEEQERAAKEEEQREVDIARGNPLLNPGDNETKRRWDDDVIFKNQARGTEDKKKREFVNDLLRSDFHKRFMDRYVR